MDKKITFLNPKFKEFVLILIFFYILNKNSTSVKIGKKLLISELLPNDKSSLNKFYTILNDTQD